MESGIQKIDGLFKGLNRPAHTQVPIVRVDFTQRYTYLDILDMMVAEGLQREPGFVIDANNKFTYVNVAKWIVGDPTMKALDIATGTIVPGNLNKGLFISGNTGSGKSMLMEIATKVLKELRFGYNTPRGPHLLYWPNYRADRLVSYYAQTGDIDSLIEDNATMCIQDLGSEPSEAVYMGSRVALVKRVLEARYDNRSLFTHFTSNIALRNSKELIGKYGERVYDRLRGGCNYLTIAGPSRR